MIALVIEIGANLEGVGWAFAWVAFAAVIARAIVARERNRR